MNLIDEYPAKLDDLYGDPEGIATVLYWFIGLLFIGLLAGVFILLSAGDVQPAIFVGFGEIPILLCLFFVRKQKIEFATTLLAILLIILITITATNDLGVHHISVIGYPVVLIVGSMVIRKRTMNFLVALTIACVAWLVFGEIYGYYTPAVLVQSVPGDFFSTLVIIVLTATMMRRVTEAWFKSNYQLHKELEERRQTEEKIRRQAERAEVMASLSNLFTQTSRGEELILDTVVRRCAEMIGDGASILLYSPESEYLKLGAVYNPDSKAVAIFREEMEARPVRVDEGAYAIAIGRKQPVLIESIPVDLLIEKASPERRDYYRQLPIYSMMLAPLNAQGKLLGVIGLARHAPGKNFTTEDLTFLQDIADRAALALLNAQIYRELEQELNERKHAEEALAFSEEKFSKAFHVVPVLMSIEDANNNFIDVNTAFIKAIGHKREDVIGHQASSLNMWTSPDDHKAVRDAMAEHGRLKELEMRYRRKSGETGYVLMSTEKFEVAGRSYTITSALDITERKRVEAEREKLIAELEAKNAELERFTYTVSHDLKSPLVTINGFLGYIEKEAIEGNIERLKMDVQRIASAVNKMQRLLNELLELSRIGRLMNPSETVPFEEITNDALKIVQGRLANGNIRVILQPGLPAVHGDRQRLTELMQNLLDNAAKFTGDQPEPRIEIGQRGEEHGKPIFYVKDNGIGIAPEFHERIFGLFNKLDPNVEGTGVGLALVKRIIEIHGGRIWVESEAGSGSSFLFTLPVE